MSLYVKVFGDLTSIVEKLGKERLPMSDVNKMKAVKVSGVFNTHNYESVNDLFAVDAKIYTPEQERSGKVPLTWAQAAKTAREFDDCFDNAVSNTLYVLHEQSRANVIAVVWRWSGVFARQLPAPYSSIKPTGKPISIVGITEMIWNDNGQISDMGVTYDTEEVLRQLKGGAPRWEIMMAATSVMEL